MSEKASLTDYDSGDFSCIEEYEHWVIVNFTKLETQNAELLEALEVIVIIFDSGGTIDEVGREATEAIRKASQ